ncbi:MAG: Vgb family protein, partial [Caldimonas sp.]
PPPPPVGGAPTVSEFSVAANGIAPSLDGGSIVLAGDGNLWFSGGFQPTRIGRITAAGNVSYPVTGAATLATFAAGPLATGPDGNVWFCNPVGGVGLSGAVGSVDVTTGVAVEYASPLLQATAQVRLSTTQELSCTGGVCTPVAPGSCVAAGATTCRSATTGPTLVAACAASAANAGNAYTATSCATTTTAPVGVTSCTAAPASAGNGFVATTCSGITPGSQAYAIAAGPDGNLWFTEYVANRIGKFDIRTRIATEYGPLAAPATAIAAGPDGNVWFVENGNAVSAAVIGRITPAGAITELDAGFAVGESIGAITAGADGSLWFVKNGSGGAAIGRLDPASGAIAFFRAGLSGRFPVLGAIAAGPDGNVWFTDYLDGSVGRIASDGTIVDYAIATPNLAINAIAAGPVVAGAKTLWFTEPSAKMIGRATLP